MSRRRIDISGQIFGLWKVLEFDPKLNEHGQLLWLCLCECGTLKRVMGHSLKRGKSKSCGCKKLVHKGKEEKHGMSKSSTYKSYYCMLTRCYNMNDLSYLGHGARGIRVCDRWRNSFLLFLNDMGSRPVGYTLERIDNSGDYEPKNCKWATPHEQARNRKDNRMITYKDKTRCMKDWANEYSMDVKTLEYRLNSGWSIEDSLTKPSQRRRNGNES